MTPKEYILAISGPGRAINRTWIAKLLGLSKNGFHALLKKGRELKPDESKKVRKELLALATAGNQHLDNKRVADIILQHVNEIENIDIAESPLGGVDAMTITFAGNRVLSISPDSRKFIYAAIGDFDSTF